LKVELRALRKSFGVTAALDDVTLSVPTGEFLAVLGPSGSGKTSLLRVLAGLDFADSGQIVIGGRQMEGVPARERGVGFVFQNYALFRHMSVARNVAFGLEIRPRRNRPSARDIKNRVASLLELMGIGDLGGRFPDQISGGQRQRVALARAVVNRPKVLLLDEPLGALDAALRQEMQVELKRIQGDVGITFVYVTHDQEEALTMSDRLAVFNRGRIEQVGPPAEVYERPANTFVAGFVGVSNLLERGGRRFTVRPEKVRLDPEGEGLHIEEGRIRDVAYAGMVTRYLVELDGGGELQVVRQNLETSSADALEQKGRRVRIGWREEHTFAIENKEDT
jgi:putative spermidine/putrescine transport system ATP-binding protein